MDAAHRPHTKKGKDASKTPPSTPNKPTKDPHDNTPAKVSGDDVLFKGWELPKINMRLMTASMSTKTTTWVPPKEQEVPLLFLRQLFSQCLYEREKRGEESREELLPAEVFHRVFDRLFFVLHDPQGFEEGSHYDSNNDGWISWKEFFHVYRRRHITIKLNFCERVYLAFDSPDPSDASFLARFISYFVLAAIIFSSICFILATLPELQDMQGDGQKPKTAEVFGKIDVICLMLFTFEYLVRLVTCWGVRSELFEKATLMSLVTGHDPIVLPSSATRLLYFFIAIPNLIDLAAILPGIIGLFLQDSGNGGGFVVLRLIRLTRIFRAFKNPALTEPVIVIARTMEQSTKALYVLVFNMFLGIVIFGSLMFLAEGQGKWDPSQRKYLRKGAATWNPETLEWEDYYEPSPWQSIPSSFWWAIVTATTVGYGDEYPITPLGKIVSTFTMLFSLIILALPVGVIGNCFSTVWDAYAYEREEFTKTLESETNYITESTQSLDPSCMSNLMLIEVWNDDNSDARSCPSNFMGEVKMSMELPMTCQVSKTQILPLEANHDIIQRSVVGKLMVHYKWTPYESERVYDARVLKGIQPEAGLTEPQPEDDNDVGTFDLRGKLDITIINAEGLMNLDCSDHSNPPNPYCVVLLYPKNLQGRAGLVPTIWRTPSVFGSRRVTTPFICWKDNGARWHAHRAFNFKWCTPRVVEDNWDKTFKEVSKPKMREGENGDEVDKRMVLVVDTIKRLSAELRTVKESVHGLANRVDMLAYEEE